MENSQTEKFICDDENKAEVVLEIDELCVWMHADVIDSQELTGPKNDDSKSSMYLARSKLSHNPFLANYIDLEAVINRPNYLKIVSDLENYYDLILTSDQKSFLWGPKNPLVKLDHNYCAHVDHFGTPKEPQNPFLQYFC